jgi:hypothetical protein
MVWSLFGCALDGDNRDSPSLLAWRPGALREYLIFIRHTMFSCAPIRPGQSPKHLDVRRRLVGLEPTGLLDISNFPS